VPASATEDDDPESSQTIGAGRVVGSGAARPLAFAENGKAAKSADEDTVAKKIVAEVVRGIGHGPAVMFELEMFIAGEKAGVTASAIAPRVAPSEAHAGDAKKARAGKRF